MRVEDILNYRSDLAAGLYLALTQRCPLLCAHCSTNSSLLSPLELEEKDLLRFIGSIEPELAPKFILLTGGEPLLRTRLIHELVNLIEAHELPSKICILTGLYFARGLMPPSVREVLKRVDHVTASLDTFHEVFVTRERAFQCLKEIQAIGVDISLQLCSTQDNDPYIRELVDDSHKALGNSLSIFISKLQKQGRAQDLPTYNQISMSDLLPNISPCGFASWPVVSYSGNIVTCCNTEVVNHAKPPEHLILGHIHTSTWNSIHTKLLGDRMLRSIRTFGPLWLSGKGTCRQSYCQTCHSLTAESCKQVIDENESSEDVYSFLHDYISYSNTINSKYGLIE